MKNMPGMGDLQGMLSKMGMNMGGKGGSKVNVSAMQSNLDKKLKEAKNRERLLKKVEEKKAAMEAAAAEAELSKLYAAAYPQENAKGAAAADAAMENLVFSTGESVERSTPSDKKKNKKKKNK
jgi:uncharacterized iron-regulated protein